MSPKSPTKVSPEQPAANKDKTENKDATGPPKKEMIVEFNGGERAKIRTAEGSGDLASKGMMPLLSVKIRYWSRRCATRDPLMPRCRALVCLTAAHYTAQITSTLLFMFK